MNIAFLTELTFSGNVPTSYLNMRTEFAWMSALNATHFHIWDFPYIIDFDWVFIIFPKGGTSLNAEGVELNNDPNRFSDLYRSNFIETIKQNNKKIAFVQEGPTWYFNDFSLADQFNFFNQISQCDFIFCHNEYDSNWYRGMFPNKPVHPIPTLLIEDLILSIKHSKTPREKTIIGGNFCRWYGGFQSYLVASEFQTPIYTQTSHCSRPGEEQISNLNIIPRLIWFEWMNTLASFKYAVHLMPTIAAGSFSLNCAYFGIPCIGNIKVDTQRICFPDLSVEPEDVFSAKSLAIKLKNEKSFYDDVSQKSMEYYNQYYTINTWKTKIYTILRNSL